MIMDRNHPKWDEFIQRLEGPEGCNFREEVPGDSKTITWTCKGGKDKSFSKNLLKDYNVDIEGSLSWFEKNGGFCDCEILYNI